eukprot:m.22116 g.22116  ORF g.22116 m.22116 type:complete len:440 (-) comp7344_c0_seq1:138-1457(-)
MSAADDDIVEISDYYDYVPFLSALVWHKTPTVHWPAIVKKVKLPEKIFELEYLSTGKIVKLKQPHRNLRPYKGKEYKVFLEEGKKYEEDHPECKFGEAIKEAEHYLNFGCVKAVSSLLLGVVRVDIEAVEDGSVTQLPQILAPAEAPHTGRWRYVAVPKPGTRYQIRCVVEKSTDIMPDVCIFIDGRQMCSSGLFYDEFVFKGPRVEGKQQYVNFGVTNFGKEEETLTPDDLEKILEDTSVITVVVREYEEGEYRDRQYWSKMKKIRKKRKRQTKDNSTASETASAASNDSAKHEKEIVPEHKKTKHLKISTEIEVEKEEEGEEGKKVAVRPVDVVVDDSGDDESVCSGTEWFTNDIEHTGKIRYRPKILMDERLNKYAKKCRDTFGIDLSAPTPKQTTTDDGASSSQENSTQLSQQFDSLPENVKRQLLDKVAVVDLT